MCIPCWIRVSLIWPLAVLLLIPAAAADCGINPDILGASYLIEKQSAGSKDTRRESLNLWRLHNEVAHERPERHYTDVWRWLRSGSIERHRYNDALKREERMGGTAQPVLWAAKYQLLPPEALSQMQLLEQSGTGCKRVEKYRQKLAAGQLTVWWNPSLQLVLLLDRQGDGVTTTMKLTGVESGGQVIAEAFNRRLTYAVPNETGAE